VEGIEALKVWIWFAIQTPRYRYSVYTWDYGNEFEVVVLFHNTPPLFPFSFFYTSDYGNEFEDFVGQGYSEEYIEAEAQAMIEECLLVNEYIEGIADFSAVMENSRLTVSFTAETAFGDIQFSDNTIYIR